VKRSVKTTVREDANLEGGNSWNLDDADDDVT